MTKHQRVKLKPFQDKFMFSEARYPAMVSAIGTGKTMCLLAKIWGFCEAFPDSLALVVRKEYTDMRDSTLKDMDRYFGVGIDSNKEYRFPNGSIMMFRHGEELNVLKNVNLSIFGIEQAEEFETDEQFTFLRDRLRRENSPYRQGCIVANACGHNWVWEKWLYKPIKGSCLVTATTFDNEENLPADFIQDLRQMEKDAPNHYKQYVLNSFDEVDANDLLLTGELVYASPKREFKPAFQAVKILGVDVARFGDDETVFSILERREYDKWEQVYMDKWQGKDLMQVCGRVVNMFNEYDLDAATVDDIGVGGGVTDRLSELRLNILPFNSSEKATNPDKYANRRSEGYFRLQELFSRGQLKILDDPRLMEQLLSIRFKYKSSGAKAIVSKDEMRKNGLASPDRADALMYALYFKDSIITDDNVLDLDNAMKASERFYNEWNPFEERF